MKNKYCVLIRCIAELTKHLSITKTKGSSKSKFSLWTTWIRDRKTENSQHIIRVYPPAPHLLPKSSTLFFFLPDFDYSPIGFHSSPAHSNEFFFLLFSIIFKIIFLNVICIALCFTFVSITIEYIMVTHCWIRFNLNHNQ